MNEMDAVLALPLPPGPGTAVRGRRLRGLRAQLGEGVA